MDPSGAKRTRAHRACQFCRHRKMRCGNEQPQCLNCKSYGQDCVYVEAVKKARPSNYRISRLEEENRKLQESLALARSNDIGYSAAGPNGSSGNRGESSTSQTHHPKQSSKGPGAEAEYHGPSNIFFDHASPDGKVVSISSIDQNVPLEWTQKSLMAEAAQQRQFETINLSLGKLDFDGIEPSLAMDLLSLYWNRLHPFFLLVYRPAFMRDMACGGPYYSKLLLNAICFNASKFTSRVDVRSDSSDVTTAGWSFRQRFGVLLAEALDRSKITTVQALLCMATSLSAMGEERSVAWLYSGLAIRMIVDLGIHTSASRVWSVRRLTHEDLEIRRRVFWGAFIIDKLQSLWQGRPVSLQEVNTMVPMTFLDQYEELENWVPYDFDLRAPYPGHPAYTVSTFKELCRLSIVLNRILNNVYSEDVPDRGSKEFIKDLNSLHADLEAWHKALPCHLIFELKPGQAAPPTYLLNLWALYNSTLILLHRPIVSDSHLPSRLASVAVDSFKVCAKAAKENVQLLELYDRTYSLKKAPYALFYGTYVSATIHVRIAAQRNPGSEAHADLATCLSVFDQNQDTNPAVNKAKAVVKSLMDRMGVVIKEKDSPSGLLAPSSEYPEAPGGLAAPNANGYTSLSNNTNEQNWGFDDLDIDMIVQSFIREQQGRIAVSAPISYAKPGVAQSFQQSPAPALPPPVESQYYPNTAYYGSSNSYAGNTSLSTGELPMADMLFGFTGSNLDGIW